MALQKAMAVAPAGEVKLLGVWSSAFVMRARIALNVKAVEYEFLEETMGSKSELLLKSNPAYKKIPVLLHRDRPICESLIIVQYIDETWPDGPALLPSDPYDRAIARFWAAYLDDKWFQPFLGILKAPTQEARAELAGQVKESLRLLEEAFEKCSKGKAFFGGDSIGLLDIALGSYLPGTRVSDKIFGFNFLDVDKVPNLVAWADRFSADAAVKEVMPDEDKLAEYVRNIQERFRGEPSPSAN